MKLGDGGEAFFVFQTDGDIPEDMRTSPIASPSQSPVLPAVMPDMTMSVFPSCVLAYKKSAMGLQEPDYLDLNKANGKLEKDDAKSESNVQLSRAIDIIRPASTDGTHPLKNPNRRLRFKSISPTYSFSFQSFTTIPTSSTTIRRLDRPSLHRPSLPRLA